MFLLFTVYHAVFPSVLSLIYMVSHTVSVLTLGCVFSPGGVNQSFCPYKCISDKYRMPNCYTPLEELMYTFGGPWPFALLLSGILVLLAVLLSTLRIKLVESSSYVANIEHRSCHHLPYLLSLSEVYC